MLAHTTPVETPQLPGLRMAQVAARMGAWEVVLHWYYALWVRDPHHPYTGVFDVDNGQKINPSYSAWRAGHPGAEVAIEREERTRYEQEVRP